MGERTNGPNIGRLDVHIVGMTPTLQHNGQLADPSNRYATAMKEITSKKKKTEADYGRLADLEWEGSLYLDDDMRVVWPGDVIEGALARAARATRDGMDARAGIISDGMWRLIYKGPQTLEGLRADPNFRDRRSVVNPSTKARVMRVRPIFREWELKFTVNYFTNVLNRDDVVRFLEKLADMGLSDNRPKFGKFLIKDIKAA